MLRPPTTLITLSALTALLLSVPVYSAAPDCDRLCLLNTANTYLRALAENNPDAAPLADDVAFVENITRLQPGAGLWASATAVSASYRILIPDPRQHTIGIMTVVTHRSDNDEASKLLAARLKLAGREIIEAEHLVGDIPPIVDMARLSKPRAAMVTEVAPAERMPYLELATIAASYYDGLNLSDGSLVPFAEDCERQENGMITGASYLGPEVFDQVDVNGNPPPPVATDCKGQMDSRRFAYIDSIDNRRVFAVDPVQGLVMSLSHFRQSMAKGPHRMMAADGTEVMWDEDREAYDLPAAHIFKITDGLIHEVEAVGIFVPYDADTGWE
ncbi:MAG: hypothetical protein ACO3R5_09290 [Pseudohongiellaceae bacterium]